jgi:hydroxyacylglutathione hydrolase
MSHLDMHVFICGQDNYGCLVHDNPSGATAAIDAPDAGEIERQLRQRGWQLTHIWITHHHGDHTAGNLALKEQFGCRILGPEAEASRIPGIAKTVKGGDTFSFAGRDVKVISTPGHTQGHIAYHIPAEHSLFAGDTLFAMGCGRVLEGSMEEMWSSLDTLRQVPPHTYLYCGHEYTEKNAEFCLTIEPANRALSQRADQVKRQRQRGELTIPATMGDEQKTNVFLRPESEAIRATLAMTEASNIEIFAELRRRKDRF